MTFRLQGEINRLGLRRGLAGLALWVGLLPAALAQGGDGGCQGCMNMIPVDSEEQSDSGDINTPQPSASFFGVAVLDTGVGLNAPMNGATLVPGSASFVGGNPLVDLADQGTHGTAVAQVILTLAPGSKIMSVQTSTGGRSVSSSAVTQGMLHAAANSSIRVINHSNAALTTVPGSAILAAAAADQVVVMQAGNDSSANPVGDALHAPGLGGKGLIVGGLGPDGDLLGFSNRAGGYAQHYVVALGASEFAGYWGTSFATPRASALAARLRQTWPNLKAEQVVDIIKRSATDMGALGVDDKYGWGRINFVRAFQPLGPVVTPAGVNDKENAELTDPPEDDFRRRRLRLSPAIFSALAHQPWLARVLVVDRYARDFTLNVASRVSQSGEQANARWALDRLFGAQPTDILAQGVGYRLLSYQKTYRSAGASTEPALVLALAPEGNTAVGLGYRVRPDATAGVLHWLGAQGFAAGAGTAWQQGLIGQFRDDGLHSRTTYRVKPQWRLGFDFADVSRDGDTGHNSQLWGFATHFGASNWGISLRGDLFGEAGSLYGGSAGGALSVSSSQTRAMRLSGYRRLSGNWAAMGAYTGALTQVASRPGALLSHFSALAADAWLVGLAGKSLFSQTDAVRVTVSQPLRVVSGEAELDIVYDLGPQGEIRRHRERTSLVPAGSETLLEFDYRQPLTPTLSVGAYAAFRHRPSHDRRAESQVHVMGVVQGAF